MEKQNNIKSIAKQKRIKIKNKMHLTIIIECFLFIQQKTKTAN